MTNDIPPELVKPGLDLLKVSNKGGRVKMRKAWIEHSQDDYWFCWEKATLKKSNAISLSSITTALFGSEGTTFRTALRLSPRVQSTWLTIIYDTDKRVHFICPSVDVLDLLRHVLRSVKQTGSIPAYPTPLKLSRAHSFSSLNTLSDMSESNIDLNQVKAMCARMHLGMNEQNIERAFEQARRTMRDRIGGGGSEAMSDAQMSASEKTLPALTGLAKSAVDTMPNSDGFADEFAARRALTEATHTGDLDEVTMMGFQDNSPSTTTHDTLNADAELKPGSPSTLSKSPQADYGSLLPSGTLPSTSTTSSNISISPVLSFPAFQEFVRLIRVRADIVPLYNELCTRSDAPEGISYNAFVDFLHNVQKSFAKQPAALFNKYRNPQKGTILLDGLTAFLASPSDNPGVRTRSMDMTRPLYEYFVNSSHNTYLTGSQFQGTSAVSGYIHALQQGCRSVEIDVHDGVTITHGHSLTSKINVVDVLRAIHKYAFVTSPLPLILSLEVRCDIPQQDILAELLERHLAPYLLTQPLSSTPNYPSPADLKYKILVKTKNKFISARLRRASTAEAPRSASDADYSSSDASDASNASSLSSRVISKVTRSGPQLWAALRNSPHKQSSKGETGDRSDGTDPYTLSETASWSDINMSRRTSTRSNSITDTELEVRTRSESGASQTDGRTRHAMPDMNTVRRTSDGLGKNDTLLPISSSDLTSDRLSKLDLSDVSSDRPMSDDTRVLSSSPVEMSFFASLKHKRSSLSHTLTNDKRIQPPTSDRSGQTTTRRTSTGEEKRQNLQSIMSQRLAQLLIYTVGVKNRGINKKEIYETTHVISFSERQLVKLIKNDKVSVVRHNRAHLTRVYPKASRVTSTNFLPHHFWNAGVQMVALNWQTLDTGMALNTAMFNHSRGYILKPEILRHKLNKPIKDSIMLNQQKTYSLQVDIISAQQISTLSSVLDDSASKSNISPFVEVALYVPGQSTTTKSRSKIESNNAFNPIFNTSLSFTFSHHPSPDMLELVFLNFDILNSADENSFLASYCVSLGCLQPGYRHVPLYDSKGDQFLFSSLFIKSVLST